MKNGAIEPVARVTWLIGGGGAGVEREGNSRQKQRGANEPRVSVRKLQVANPTHLRGDNISLEEK